MKEITKDNFSIALEILIEAYKNNPGTNLVVGTKGNKRKRLEKLMRYAIYKSSLQNGAFLADDNLTVILILFPKRKINWSKLIFHEMRLLFEVIGFFRLSKVLRREQLLSRNHPKDIDYIHLWLMGIRSDQAGKGRGGDILRELTNKSKEHRIPIIVETVELPHYYEKFGFKTFFHLNNFILRYHFMEFIPI